MSRALIESLKSFPLHVRPELIGGFAEMSSLFKAISYERGLPISYSARIATLIPESIQKLPCFLDKLTGLWRYEYGKPITLSTGGTVVGTPMFPEVERLFEVVCCAAWRLDADELSVYLARLTDPGRHEDVIVEFAPVLRLPDTVIVEHEVCGNGVGNSTVDWSIQSPGEPKLLLEVKNRIRDLIESFEAMASWYPDQPIPPPSHDHSMLFRSVAPKFQTRLPGETIQGVWIKSELKQEKTQLQRAFWRLDNASVHVAVLGNWGPEAYVLANDAATKRRVLKILRVRHCPGLVF